MTPAQSPQNSMLEAAREQMIAQQLRPVDVLEPSVLAAIHAVRREVFVPDAFRHVAFADDRIPLGHGQFMLPPKLDGKILQALAIQSGDVVLDIGTGSGFLAACLAKLGGRVRSVEIHPDLAERARTNIHTAAANNVVVEAGDAAQLTEEDRYDAIAVTAAIPPQNAGLEQRLQRALRVGGRLFMVTGSKPVMEAVKITRTTPSHWQREALFETVLEPLVNAVRPPSFVF